MSNYKTVLNEFLDAVSTIEEHYFNKIHSDQDKRNHFLTTKCCINDTKTNCPNSRSFPKCTDKKEFTYLNCYLYHIKKYLYSNYKLNWMTVTLFTPTTEDIIDNFNLGNDLPRIKKFYEYFSDSSKYSASKSLFVDKYDEISKKFPTADIFKIFYDKKKKIIKVNDALKESAIPFDEQPPSETSFDGYVNIMTETSQIEMNYLYFFIFRNINPLSKKGSYSGLYIPSKKRIYRPTLLKISAIVKIFLAPIEKTRSLVLLSNEYDRKLGYSIKAAMAAIMSRNGSHNIGSHVLSAVSNQVNDLSDDKILFNYIQERMDFIAQITTENAKWTFSSAFIQDLMRRFYMQRHLLNHLSSSEGLTAYEFQKREKNEFIPVKFDNQKNNLVIKCVNSFGDIVIGPENNSDEDLLTDLNQLAIPGGVIGQQAFYTILENIVRNSAKHNWANSIEYGKPINSNLVITIKYFDDPNKEYILFKVYDNISNVFNNSIHLSESEKKEKALQLLSDNYDPPKKPLHQQINEKMICSFIDESTGELKNENWGLAEIKICSGFLNKKGVVEYGLLKEKILFGYDGNESSGFISAIGEKDDSGEYRLCYQFPIPKPKEIIIVVENNIISEVDIIEAKKYGISFVDTLQDYDAEIVVFTDQKFIKYGDIINKENYPFRLVLIDKEGNIEKSASTRILHIQVQDDFYNSYLSNMPCQDGICKWEMLKLKIYGDWIRYFYNRRNIFQQPLPIHIRYREETRSNNYTGNTSGYFDSFTIDRKYRRELKKILFKNDEDIETLPRIFRSKLSKQEEKRKYFVTNLAEVTKNLMIFGGDGASSKILLKRHFDANSMVENGSTYIYQEALSGSQIYFNIFETQLNAFMQNKFFMQILENALIRIAIIDERYWKHYNKKDGVHQRVIKNACIYPFEGFIVDSRKKVIGNNSGTEHCLDFNNIKENEYDAIIIHQTLLDEFLNNVFEDNKFENFCSIIKNFIPLVIITSGRGKPDKLPSNAKFLPFSNLDTFLIKDYHEKFLLTQAILKLTRE